MSLIDEIRRASLREFYGSEEECSFATPGDLARAVLPTTVQTSALRLIDQELVRAYEEPNSRIIFTMPPQEGKSTRVTVFGPLWFLLNNPRLRIAIASYGQDLANEFGRDIRNHIADNSGQEGTLDLGLRIAADNGAVSSWRLAKKGGGVRSVGLGSGLTGRPADALFIDDPISNMEQAESITYRNRVWNWWLSVGSTRLAPGAPVIVILTRWHHDDIVGRIMSSEDAGQWKIINIPAEAEEDDILGREPGEYLESARGRTEEDWEAIKVRSGPRVWSAMYQGHPTPDRGGIFCDVWPEYDQPMWVERRDGSLFVPGLHPPHYEMAQSWDMAFKDTQTSSYVVGQVWLRIGLKCYLLDQVRDRMNFNEAMEALKSLSARWPQAVAKFIEDKANGTAIIAALQQQIPGLIPVEPEGGKYARASAVSPFTHSGSVVLPAPLTETGEPLAPWVTGFKEELRDFPNAANDDQVDATSQALNQLLLVPLLSEDVVEPEEWDDYDSRGWSISPV